MEDADTISQSEFAQIAEPYEAKIMPNDILSIIVNTSNPAASKDFNLSLVPQGQDNPLQTNVYTAGNTNGTLQNYIVDNNGYVNMPILGLLKISGLTKKQAEKKIYDLIYPKYLTEEPIVIIRFLNYKVTLLGEVAKPGEYNTPNGKITLLDALAQAGDLTIYGNRKNVLLIREDANGERMTRQINLQDKNILLDNEIYYLQQNDIIYVQPNKTRGNSSSIGSLESLALSGFSLLISIISIITR